MSDEIIQAAWLYHVGQLNQEQVSQHLGISRFRVLRLLAEAQELGLVRVSIEHETTQTLKLADELRTRFNLKEVQIAPDTGGSDTAARQSVGILAAGFLARIGRADHNRQVTIGVGWGRTVAAMADALTGLYNQHNKVADIDNWNYQQAKYITDKNDRLGNGFILRPIIDLQGNC